MRNELIFLFVVTLAVAGCAKDDHQHDSGAGSAAVSVKSGNNSPVTITIGELTDLDIKNSDQGVVTADQKTAEPEYAIPVENGIDANNISSEGPICREDSGISVQTCLENGGQLPPAIPEA